MNFHSTEKIAIVMGALDRLTAQFRVVPMREHAATVRERIGHAPRRDSVTVRAANAPEV